MKPIRIVLAEDQKLIRAGIRALLKEVSGAHVVAETGDGREALRLIKQERPDLALLDISMPGLNGLEVAARISREFPAIERPSRIVWGLRADSEQGHGLLAKARFGTREIAPWSCRWCLWILTIRP